jgi:molecular chaperone DnaK (HSP70)
MDQFSKMNVGHECDETLDNVIDNLKSFVLGTNFAPNINSKDVLATSYATKGAVVEAQGYRLLPAGRETKAFPAEELIGYFLSYLKECAEDYLARKPIREINRIDGSEIPTTVSALQGAVQVSRVVLGVPANCTEHSKNCLRAAATAAGFKEARDNSPILLF